MKSRSECLPADLSADWLEERPDLLWSSLQVDEPFAGPLAVPAVPGGDDLQTSLGATKH